MPIERDKTRSARARERKKEETNLNQFTRRSLEKHLLTRSSSGLEVDNSLDGRSRLVLSRVELGSIWTRRMKKREVSRESARPFLFLVLPKARRVEMKPAKGLEM